MVSRGCPAVVTIIDFSCHSVFRSKHYVSKKFIDILKFVVCRCLISHKLFLDVEPLNIIPLAFAASQLAFYWLDDWFALVSTRKTVAILLEFWDEGVAD